MTSKQSVSNNCNRPLSGDASGNTFTGAWESSAGALVLGVFVASPTLGYVTIQQSNNRGVNIQLTDTFNVGPADLDAMTVFRVPSGFAWFRVTFHNDEGNQTYLSLNTYLESSYTAPATIAGSVTVSGTVAVSSVAGVVDVSGNVVSTPATTAAQLRHMPLVVGHWYQVASVGDTIGAVWAEMGAIWDGEGLPPVGRQFQCLYAGYGTGTCYDITAPVDATATTLPTLSYNQSAVGSLVAPQQLIGCKLMGVASTITHEEQWINDGGAIPVFGTVGIDTGNNVVQLDPASSLPAGSNVIGLVGFDVANNIVRIDDGTLPLPVSIDSAGNTVKLDPASQLPAGVNNLGSIIVSDAYSTIVVTSITNPLPAGSNTLGVVGIDPAANTIKIDQTSNGVKINPTAQPPVRVTGLGDTSKSIGGPGLLYGASYQNKSAAVNCWVKLYDSVGAPTAGDTPFVIQYLESVQQYNLTSANDNFFNTPIVNTLWVRATLLPDDNDVSDTGIDAELTCFVGV